MAMGCGESWVVVEEEEEEEEASMEVKVLTSVMPSSTD